MVIMGCSLLVGGSFFEDLLEFGVLEDFATVVGGGKGAEDFDNFVLLQGGEFFDGVEGLGETGFDAGVEVGDGDGGFPFGHGGRIGLGERDNEVAHGNPWARVGWSYLGGRAANLPCFEVDSLGCGLVDGVADFLAEGLAGPAVHDAFVVLGGEGVFLDGVGEAADLVLELFDAGGEHEDGFGGGVDLVHGGAPLAGAIKKPGRLAGLTVL